MHTIKQCESIGRTIRAYNWNPKVKCNPDGSLWNYEQRAAFLRGYNENTPRPCTQETFDALNPLCVSLRGYFDKKGTN